MKTIEIEAETLIEAKYALRKEVARTRRDWAQVRDSQFISQHIREIYKEIHREAYCGAKKALEVINSHLA